MRVIDAGHHYLLRVLDGDKPEFLRFVKRTGPKYPGNYSAYSGTTVQEVLRVCIDRLKYVDKQIPHPFNSITIDCLRAALWWLERRAFERHEIPFDLVIDQIEELDTNSHGHLWRENE